MTEVLHIPDDIPDDFPHFLVPGHEDDMAALRMLFWKHFLPDGPAWDDWLNGPDLFPRYPILPSGPKTTLWDEWLCASMLWPAVESNGIRERMQARWRESLGTRAMDSAGYVTTNNGASYAHLLGWPFPAWSHGSGGYGWHFSFKGQLGELGTPNGMAYRPPRLCNQDGWQLNGASDQGIDGSGWHLTLTRSDATADTPRQSIDTFQAPFLQIRWNATQWAGEDPYVEWASDEMPAFSASRRVYFDPPSEAITHVMIPMYRHPAWQGIINCLRIGFANQRAGAQVLVQGFFTQYDTRHNINNLNYVRGCAIYFNWTRDLAFLRQTIQRIRLAMRSYMQEHQTREHQLVLTTWVGHDGISGLVVNPDGSKTIRCGHGIPNNYWDILPFGHQDAYATIHYYDTLRVMAALERDILQNPGWNIPPGIPSFNPDELLAHAEEVKAKGNQVFWNPDTGRLVACIDAEGVAHDHGFTSLNLEAIYYGFTTPEHAGQILQWLNGKRIIASDTAQGPDIYHWRFAPRTTTRHNLDYWYWGYNAPERTPWGGQVQDGGAVLGFSYYDIMARLAVHGPDDAWQRLREIITWFRETQAAGGYSTYYSKQPGTLQGANVAGALGIGNEFFESVMVPQVMIHGFLGFAPAGDGFRLEPRLPGTWPELNIDHVRWRTLTLNFRVSAGCIEIAAQGRAGEPHTIYLPAGRWRMWRLLTGARELIQCPDIESGIVSIDWSNTRSIRFHKID